jgi:hypothetical protein
MSVKIRTFPAVSSEVWYVDPKVTEELPNCDLRNLFRPDDESSAYVRNVSTNNMV